MTKSLTVAFLVASMTGSATAATNPCSYPQNGPGMFLCQTPEVASRFWKDIQDLRDGHVTVENVAKAGVRERCKFIKDNSMRPYDFLNGLFYFDTDQGAGYADPHVFIRYMMGS